MSFFFTKPNAPVKPAPTAGRAVPRNVNKARQSAAALGRLGCKACPLAKLGERIEENVPDKCDVLFLAEKPSKKDEQKGKPLYGTFGKLVNEVTPDEYRKRVGYATIIQHRPPNDREADYVEIEACRNHIIAAIEKAKPKLIIGLGITVLKWALDSADMTGMRGRMFTVKIGKHVCYFMPTFDPDYVRHHAYDKDKPLQNKIGGAYKQDVENGFRFIANADKPYVITEAEAKENIQCYNGDKRSFLGLSELLSCFKDALKAKKYSLDFETYPLRPYSEGATVLTASISYHSGDHVSTFAFAIDHPNARWTKDERKQLMSAFKKLIIDGRGTRIAHNVPFELEWLIFLFGLEIVQHRKWEDTMMMAHLLDERKGAGREEDRRPTYQNLNFLCKQHFGLALKGMFNLNKKDMRKADLDDTLLYNGCDSKFTLLLHDLMYDLLERENLIPLFNLAKTRQTTVAVMQHLGVPINQKKTLKFQKKLAGELETITNEIKDLKVVKQYEKDKGQEFNPSSGPELIVILRDYLKRDEIKVAGKKYGDPDRIATDKSVLDRIDHPIAPAILKLRNRQKLKSTYVDEFVLGEGKLIYPDGMLHTNFNTTFTTSGRLSSDDPNLQNFPKREDKWVRAQLEVPKGYVLLSIDYGQLEWCLACICARDKVMVDATWTGYDVHMVWAEKIAKRWPKLVGGKKYLSDKDKLKKARGLVKNKMVFPAIFGATQDSIAGYLSMPDNVAKPIFEEFWDTFSGLGSWQKKLMRHYYDTGYVDNLFGRRRRYPMTKNEAINHPIQSTAADIVCEAMDRLSMLSFETGIDYLHPRLNIHDDLTFIVPDNDRIIDETIEICVKEMLKLPFDFVNVPMSCEVSIGTNWENQEEIGKFWTHDIGRTDPSTKECTRID